MELQKIQRPNGQLTKWFARAWSLISTTLSEPAPPSSTGRVVAGDSGLVRGPCEPEISAPLREQRLPLDSSEGSSGAEPTTEELYRLLKETFPENWKKLFPESFGWVCPCEKDGFPGCSDVEHFCQRVFLSILDYHQVQESRGRGAVKIRGEQQQLLRVRKFSKARNRLLEADLTTAEEVLSRSLSNRPTGPP